MEIVSVHDALSASRLASGTESSAPKQRPSFLSHRILPPVATVIAITGLLFFESTRQQDLNWDLLNYHYYSAHAFLHNRLAIDIASAGLQTYHNPIIYIPSYYLIQYAPPTLVRVFLTALHGLSFVFVTLLFFRLTEQCAVNWYRQILGYIAGITSFFGPVFISLAGTTFVDNISTFPIVGGLIALFSWRHRNRPRLGDPPVWPAVGVSAFLMGIATGLKLTNIVFAAGLGAALIVTAGDKIILAKRIAIGILAGILGILVSGGWWGWMLWNAFGNPVFPYYNKLFKSPFFPEINVQDIRYIPQSIGEALFKPFRWLWESADFDPFNSMRDIRFALAFCLIFVATIAWLWKWITGIGTVGVRPNDDSKCAHKNDLVLLSTFYIASFSVWLMEFGIRRYIVSLEVISPILIILLLDSILPRRVAICMILAIVVAMIIFVRPTFYREAPFATTYFRSESLAAHFAHSQTTFFMTNGWEPASYIIPAFSADNRFIHLGGDINTEPNSPLGRKVENATSLAVGPLKAISNLPGLMRTVLAQFGLTLTGHCESFLTIADRFHVCDLERVAPHERAAAPFPLNRKVDFSDGGEGWVFEVNDACWSDGGDWGAWVLTHGAPWCSLLLFRLSTIASVDMQLTAMVHGYSSEKSIIAIELNGHQLGKWAFDDRVVSIRDVLIPAAVLHSGLSRPNILRFIDSAPETALDRQPRFGLHWLSISPVTEAPKK